MAADSPLNVAIRLLRRLRIEPERVQGALQKLARGAPQNREFDPQSFTLTPRAKHVLDLAVEQASGDGGGYVGTEHILLALASESGGVAYEVLSSLGVTPEILREHIEAITQGD